MRLSQVPAGLYFFFVNKVVAHKKGQQAAQKGVSKPTFRNGEKQKEKQSACKNRPIRPMTEHDKPLTHRKDCTQHQTVEKTTKGARRRTEHNLWEIPHQRVGQQRERTHALTSQTLLFTLLKCTGSCDLQNKHLQFSGHCFPMQTLKAQITDYD